MRTIHVAISHALPPEGLYCPVFVFSFLNATFQAFKALFRAGIESYPTVFGSPHSLGESRPPNILSLLLSLS
jgi:hypothetical protein